MKRLHAHFEYEEQVLMSREVAGIKTQMSQMVEQAQSGQLHPMQAQMMHVQLQQMGQRVLMIRQRCHHVWNHEITIESEGDVILCEKICVICETRQAFAAE